MWESKEVVRRPWEFAPPAAGVSSRFIIPPSILFIRARGQKVCTLWASSRRHVTCTLPSQSVGEHTWNTPVSSRSVESEGDSEWFLPLLSAPQIALLIEKHWCERREEKKKKERSEQNTERIDDPVEVTHKMCCWWLETRGEEDNSRLVSDSQKHLKICSFSAAHNIYHLHPSLSLSPPLKCWELL